MHSYTGGNSNGSDEPDLLEHFLSNWDINPPTPASITSSCSSASSASGGSTGVGSSAFTLNAIHSSISASVSSPTTPETEEAANGGNTHYLSDDKSLVMTKTGCPNSTDSIPASKSITTSASLTAPKRSSFMVGGKVNKGRQTVNNINKKMATGVIIKSEPGLTDGVISSKSTLSENNKSSTQSYVVNGSINKGQNEPTANGLLVPTCGAANNKKSKSIRINTSNSSATVIDVAGNSNKIAFISSTTNPSKCRSSNVTASVHNHSSAINGIVTGVNGTSVSGARNSRIIDTDITDEERRLLTKEGMFYFLHF